VQTTFPSLHVIVDPPAGGAWNMAVDEALLIEAAENGQAALRFYQWSEPTLSLGYFQRSADRQHHTASLTCPLVRRASGGGAIVHDAELTYSLALPLEDARSATELYCLMHDALIASLSDFGMKARRLSACGRGEVRPSVAGAESFLCFQRRGEGDVVAENTKIAGSAQRRRGRAVLQHGSVLLRRSIAAPELPGVFEMTGRTLTPGHLAKAWIFQLAGQGLALASPTPLESHVHASAHRLVQEKYGTDAWNRRR
jgi:lipoate-protein ligase A